MLGGLFVCFLHFIYFCIYVDICGVSTLHSGSVVPLHHVPCIHFLTLVAKSTAWSLKLSSRGCELPAAEVINEGGCDEGSKKGTSESPKESSMPVMSH